MRWMRWTLNDMIINAFIPKCSCSLKSDTKLWKEKAYWWRDDNKALILTTHTRFDLAPVLAEMTDEKRDETEEEDEKKIPELNK